MFCCRHFYSVRIEPHCRHRSTEFLTTQTDQSKRDILIDYVLMHVNTDTNGNCVLLQTAIADVSKPNDSNVWAAVRLIFDSCSQKMYIANKLQSELCLPVIERETLLVKTFGEVFPKLVTCDIVQMYIHARDGLEVYIPCHSVPEICSPISCQVIEVAKSTCPHL